VELKSAKDFDLFVIKSGYFSEFIEFPSGGLENFHFKGIPNEMLIDKGKTMTASHDFDAVLQMWFIKVRLEFLFDFLEALLASISNRSYSVDSQVVLC
jgi:hypothetical protein